MVIIGTDEGIRIISKGGTVVLPLDRDGEKRLYLKDVFVREIFATNVNLHIHNLYAEAIRLRSNAIVKVDTCYWQGDPIITHDMPCDVSRCHITNHVPHHKHD